MHPKAQKSQYSKPLKIGQLRQDVPVLMEKLFLFLGKLYGLWDRYYRVLACQNGQQFLATGKRGFVFVSRRNPSRFAIQRPSNG
jgi:hypothetical protein